MNCQNIHVCTVWNHHESKFSLVIHKVIHIIHRFGCVHNSWKYDWGLHICV